MLVIVHALFSEIREPLRIVNSVQQTFCARS